MNTKRRLATRLAHIGRNPSEHHGAVSVPVYHTSTIVFPTVEKLEHGEANPYDSYQYGRTLTPTSHAFEQAMADLEGGVRAVSFSSGLGAVATALIASLTAGGHLLMVDSTYGPTRRLCETVLKALGVETTYYDPLIGADIAALVRDNTQVIFLESPGSQTFEVQDVPAIVAVARDRGITTIMDNTWATPLFFRPLEHGVDISVQAATKYIGGHADAMLGVVAVADQQRFRRVKRAASTLGHHAGPDDVFLGLRGLRTLALRLARHEQSALTVAEWLANRPEVDRVLYPALPGDPGYEIWKRDFDGASGLLGVVLKSCADTALRTMLNGYDLFAMGWSWGGFESLVIPTRPEKMRTATRWQAAGPCLRFHIGLEDPADLIDDLTAGFERLRSAG